MEIKGFAQNLAEYMTKLSQKYYGKTWVEQFEFELWRDMREGAELIEDSEVEKLQNYCDGCQGWVKMNYHSGHLEFVDLKAWRAYYDEKSPF